MQVAGIDWFDVSFDLLLPLALVPLWFLLTYSVERAIFAGRPLTPFLKSFNMHGAIFLLGIVYVMSFTAILGLSPRTIWVSIPAWSFAFAASALWRYRKKRMAEEHDRVERDQHPHEHSDRASQA